MTRKECDEQVNRITLKHLSATMQLMVTVALLFSGLMLIIAKVSGIDEFIRYCILAPLFMQISRLLFVYRKSESRELKKYILKFTALILSVITLLAVLYSVFVVFD